MDCIFCKIISGDIPAEKVYENETFVCIRDIQPVAKVHLLLFPKKHIRSLDEAFPEGKEAQGEGLLGALYSATLKVARQEALLPDGFRTVINTHEQGGQTVFHLHLHLIGGEALGGDFG